jgi:hypothetical protein
MLGDRKRSNLFAQTGKKPGFSKGREHDADQVRDCYR